MISKKFPRIPHIPSSPGGTRDDRRLKSLRSFLHKDLVITLKMDGSNVCLTRDNVFARSHSGPPIHPSFDWLKAWHGANSYLIPEGWEVFCEYTYAVHSIRYETLPSYLWLLGIRHEEKWLSRAYIEDCCERWNVPSTPILLECHAEKEEHLEAFISKIANTVLSKKVFGVEDEGFVIWNTNEYSDHDFEHNVAKWVRANHVQTDEHWTNKPVEKQNLV